ncbi:MAG: hypothetical protein K9K38_15035 [Rhodoferax sp.]|nr:hypothetical protein [Rhodoferax sp.]
MTANSTIAPTDPYLWLEDVLGEKPLAWVRERNAVSTSLLKPDFDTYRAQSLKKLNDFKGLMRFFRETPRYTDS